MMRLALRLATFAGVTMLVTTPALAQSPAFPRIELGQTVSGSLGADDPALAFRGPFAVYSFDAQPGIRYQAELGSADFDAYLILARPVGGITEFLHQDDDGGPGTDARLWFQVEEAGAYLLVATSFGSDVSGSYHLTLSETEPPPPARAQPVALNSEVAGRLDESSAMLLTDFDELYAHNLYTIELEAGQRIRISMNSSELDAFLEFGPLGDDGFVQVTSVDDDGGEGTNADLRVTVATSGTYGIIARGFRPDPVGSYVLHVREWELQPMAARSILPGQTLDGFLSLDDAELDRGTPGQRWNFGGEAGQRVQVRMRSEDFDTFLLFGYFDGETFVELDANDDAPDDGTNSLIEITLPLSREYAILSTSLFPGREGSYTVSVAAN